RPWDGLLVALAPAFALTATINWDLLAVALTAAAMLMWSRGRALAFGVLLGLATAAKLYPFLLLGPLLVLCWRAGRWREFGTALGGAVVAWAVVNGPVMLFAFDGWSKFYTFSQERGVDFGSFWLIMAQNSSDPLSTETVNTLATLLMLLCCAGVAALGLMAPRRPRFAQLAFLIVAAFILTNKVYSPQYVLWLVPLAALARPKWRDFLIWQACEVAYFLGIWMYLAYTTSGDAHKGLPADGYHWAIGLHLLGTVYLCVMVVRDILLPERDPVRRSGDDDPSGGVFDGAEDAVVFGPAARPAQPVAHAGRTMVEWGRTAGAVGRSLLANTRLGPSASLSARQVQGRRRCSPCTALRVLRGAGQSRAATPAGRCRRAPQRLSAPSPRPSAVEETVELCGGVPQMGHQFLADLRLRRVGGHE